MDTRAIKDSILNTVLPHVPFDGWTWDGVTAATQEAGYSQDTARAVFPNGLSDALNHFAAIMDRQMLAALNNEPMPEKIRERIAHACMARLRILNEHKEAERLALQYWARPRRKYEALKILWRTADAVWTYAGDTSNDYNYYTKRTLLSGVIGATTLAFLTDDTHDLSITSAFLDRRIDHVLKIGKPMGMIFSKLKRT